MHRTGARLMEFGALAPYESALRTAGTLALRTDDGRTLELDIAQWLGPVDTADESVLARCGGQVLDVGCGPGRFVAALVRRGVSALGVDIAETAVALTRERGVPVLRRSVFGELPDEGDWTTVLLIDGNVGIGGDPLRLLRRVASLLSPDGRVLIETAPDHLIDERLTVRFTERGVAVGPEFEWAVVGAAALHAAAAAADYTVLESWSSGGREFSALAREPRPRSEAR